MKNILFIFVALCFTGCKNNPASLNDFKEDAQKTILRLQDYSYIIILKNGKDTVGNATGFFVNRCTHLFLVANIHALADMLPDYTPIKDVVFDTVIVRYGNKEKWKYLSIAVKDIVEKLATKTNQFQKPFPVDVFAYEIDNTLIPEINFVDIDNEAILDDNINNGTTAFSFGYPALDYHTERNYAKRQSKLSIGVLSDYNNLPIKIGVSNFYTSNTPGGGCSGSPIFTYYRNNDNEPVIRFLGVYYADGGDDEKHFKGVGIKSDIIRKLFFPACR